MNSPSEEFVWVQSEIVLAIHEEQLAEHGGLAGVRDGGMLESALARPRHMVVHKDRADVARPAAAYAFGIARNHPFADGNKRTALVTAELFLELNGYELLASDGDCVLTMLGVADGTLSEEDLIEWFRASVRTCR